MRKLLTSLSVVALVIGCSLVFIFADETAVQDPRNSRGAANNASSSVGIFDKLGAVDASVNQFSGDLNLSVPLVSLAGRNGLDVNISLNYSSDVSYIMNNENYVQQASWVGAGWSLVWGTIVANQHGTADIKDDEYFAILPDGNRIKLIRIGDHTSNNFKLETAPYWKVTRSMSSDEVIGWTLVDPNGVTYKFGQIESGQFVPGFGSDPDHSANRCVHRYGNWIGGSTATNESAIAYQWDLTRIIDATGTSEIQFFYRQETRTLNRTDTTPTKYTGASYLDYIIDSIGRKIVFVPATRDANEIQNLTMPFEIAQYESSYLDRVEVYPTVSALTPILTTDLEYSHLGTGTKWKLILQNVIFKGQGITTPSIKFNYAQDSGEPFGALEEIILPSGGSRKIEYLAKQNTYLNQSSDANAIIQPQTSNPGPSDCNQSAVAQPAYFANANTVIAFIDPEEGKLHMHKWRGDQWVSMAYTGYGGGGWSNNHALNTFRLAVNDHSVVVGKKLKESGNYIEVVAYNWNETTKSWPTTPVSLFTFTPPNGDYYISVAASESKLVFDLEEHLGSLNIRHSLYAYVWDSAVQGWSNIITFFHPTISDVVSDQPELTITENALLLGTMTSSNEWTRKAFLFEKVSGADALAEVPDGDAISSAGQWPTNFMAASHFSTWEPGLFRLTLLPVGVYYAQNMVAGSTTKSSFIRHSSNHILICEYSGSSSQTAKIMDRYRTATGITNWDYGNMIASFNVYDGTTRRSVSATINDRWLAYMRRLSSGTGSHDNIQIYQWNTTTSAWSLHSSLSTAGYSSNDLGSAEISFVGDKLVLHAPRASTDVFYYDGSTWSSAQRIFSGGATSEYNTVLYSCSSPNYHARYQDQFIHFAGANYVGAFRPESGIIKVKFIHGNNESDNTITDYVVQKITHSDGFTTQTTMENYSFATPKYDPSLNFAGYTTATVDVDGAYGKTVTTFHNDLTGNGNWQRRGQPAQIDIYTETNTTTPLATTQNNWVLYSDANNCYQVRLESQTETMYNVSRTTSYGYHNGNGLIKQITETNTGNSVRITTTTFAFEKYAGMSTKNMLSQVAQQTVYVSSVTAGNERSSSVTTWKDWGSSKWAPVKTYRWLENDASYGLPTFDFANWSDSGEPFEPEWVRTSKVLSRDGYSNVLEAEDAGTITSPGNVSTVKWGHNNSLPIAAFRGAKLSEVSAVDFEDGTYGDWFECCPGGVISNFSHTGEKGWYQDGASYKYLGRRFYGTELSNPSGKYTVSGWVKTSSTYPNLLWYVKYNNGSSQTWPLFQPASGSGQWEYLESTLDLSPYPNINYIEVYARNGDGSTQVFAPCYWDDLRFYPANALVSTTAYDPKTFAVTAQSDPAGITQHLHYDSFGRPTGTSNTEGKRLTTVATYFSRDGNGGNFSTSDPNFGTSVAYASQNGHSDFSTSSGWTTLNGNDGQSDVTFGVWQAGETTVRMGNTNGSGDWDGIAKYAGPGDLIARVDFYPDNQTGGTPHVLMFDGPSYRFAVRYIPSADKFRVQTNINGTWTPNAYTFNLSVPIDQWYTVEIEKRANGTCVAWVYPKSAGRNYINNIDTWSVGGYPTNWSPNVRSTCDDDYFYLANHYVGTFSQTMTYSDGLGREIQTQTRNGDYDIISKTSYNSIGKVEKQYKPQELPNATHAYYSSLSGLFELFEYFDDPLARLKMQTHMGGAISINYAYGSESFNGSTYRYEEITDETGKITKTYFDKFGNALGGRDAVGTAKEIKWVNDHDILGNVITIKPPNYWNPPAGTASGDWDSENKYNTLGQVTQTLTPDEGTTKFIYDNIGNLLYSQNSHQADPTRYDFTVTYYDKHNRVTWIGEEKNTIWNSTPPSITDTTYGKGADEWKVRHFYDVNYAGVPNYCQGKLTRTWVNDDGDIDWDHETLYVYDKFGNLVEKRITIDRGGPITQKIIKHVYDLLGRETQVIYPSNNTIARQYDAVGRLKKIYTIP
jgi:hypothetical protein